jgi:hypothetical protein
MPRNYLLSRTVDPLLGVFTGFLAYYLHETNPRTAPPPGHTLKDLVSWQIGENKRRGEAATAASAAADSAELEAVRRELDDAESVDKVIQAVKSGPEAAAAVARTTLKEESKMADKAV